jgi:hypothetical protein
MCSAENSVLQWTEEDEEVRVGGSDIPEIHDYWEFGGGERV